MVKRLLSVAEESTLNNWRDCSQCWQSSDLRCRRPVQWCVGGEEDGLGHTRSSTYSGERPRPGPGSPPHGSAGAVWTVSFRFVVAECKCKYLLWREARLSSTDKSLLDWTLNFILTTVDCALAWSSPSSQLRERRTKSHYRRGYWTNLLLLLQIFWLPWTTSHLWGYHGYKSSSYHVNTFHCQMLSRSALMWSVTRF